jgi:hypothetical protein
MLPLQSPSGAICSGLRQQNQAQGILPGGKKSENRFASMKFWLISFSAPRTKNV